LSAPENARRNSTDAVASPTALIVGVGNPLRGDDAVGLLVARRLGEDLPAGVRVVEASGETTELLDLWTGVDLVVVIDAVAAQAPAGTVYRFEVGVDPVPAVFARHSTHALGVGEAIALAAALDRLPPKLIVYGVAGRRFGTGAALSPPIVAVVDEVAARALADVTGAPYPPNPFPPIRTRGRGLRRCGEIATPAVRPVLRFCAVRSCRWVAAWAPNGLACMGEREDRRREEGRDGHDNQWHDRARSGAGAATGSLVPDGDADADGDGVGAVLR
jgi:hydrogenase maturation protease